MGLLELATLMVAVTALASLVNTLYFKLPHATGVMIAGLLLGLAITGLALLGVPAAQEAAQLVASIDFNDFVFDGVLSFLLFAGAMGINSRALWELRWPVLAFSVISTIISTFLVGGLTFWLLGAAGLHVPLIFCLVFGALISPTDPVAVLGMLKEARVPERLETLIAGESLFNDGVGVVLFSVFSGIAAASLSGAGAHVPDLSAAGVLAFFAREALGGLLLGAALGYLGWVGLRSQQDFVTEVLVSLAVVMACTTVGLHLHVSAPLAAVAAGLLVGLLTDRRPSALSSREKFGGVWRLIDELLNTFLFVLLALEVVNVHFNLRALLLAALAVPLVLFSRAVSVQVPAALLRRSAHFTPFTRRLLVWGGMRGALSVALAFSMPASEGRDLFLVMTYGVVVFSIIVQGLTMSGLARAAAEAVEGESRPA